MWVYTRTSCTQARVCALLCLELTKSSGSLTGGYYIFTAERFLVRFRSRREDALGCARARRMEVDRYGRTRFLFSSARHSCCSCRTWQECSRMLCRPSVLSFSSGFRQDLCCFLLCSLALYGAAFDATRAHTCIAWETICAWYSRKTTTRVGKHSNNADGARRSAH